MFNNWSSWDVRGLNAIMKVPELIELRVGIYDDAKKVFIDEMLWDYVERFGFKEIDGNCFDIDLKYDSYKFNMRFTNTDNGFVAMISPLKDIQEYKHIKFFIGALIRWNREGKVEKKKNKMIIGSTDSEWVVDFDGRYDFNTEVCTNYQGFLFETGTPVIIRCNSEIPFEEVSQTIDDSIEKGIRRTISSNGWLEDSATAALKGIAWNTIYEPIKKRFCTPVSRAWCSRPQNEPYYFGSYVLFAWDTFFASLLSSLDSEISAYMQVRTIIQEKNSRGMIANYAAQNGSSLDRSQPPVGSYCVLKLYKQYKNIEILQQSYTALLEWNHWWLENRDGNKDGLLEWGSDKYENYMANTYEEFKQRNGESHYSYPLYDTNHNITAARLESGLDNSPMYDNAFFNEEANTMELIDVGLNSLFAMDCWALSEIASILGDIHKSEELNNTYITIKTLINDNLWNEELGIYCNRDWNGEFSNRLSPTSFYPMISGVATKERAEIMVKKHLLNEEEFWGEYIIPSISRKDEAFFDNDYWRGRIWAPLNFLVSEGLKRYEMYDVAYEFAQKSANLFLGEWKTENHIHENYNCLSGDGDDVGLTADPVYTWGALLAYIGIGEVIEAQPWAEIKIGNFSNEPAQIINFPYKKMKLSVIKDIGLIVKANDFIVLQTNIPVVITGFCFDATKLYMSVEARSEGEMIIHQSDILESVLIKINGQEVNKVIKSEFEVIRIK